jgi:hypothetical protein
MITVRSGAKCCAFAARSSASGFLSWKVGMGLPDAQQNLERLAAMGR